MTSRPVVEEPEHRRVVDYRPQARAKARKKAWEKMTDDRDREFLAETERQLRREDPALAKRFEVTRPNATRRLLHTRLALVATSIPTVLLLLLLLVGSMILGLGLVTFALTGLAAASIWFRVRREGDETSRDRR